MSDWNWEALHRRCLDEARRFVRSPEEAEDAAQEALVRIWRSRSACRDQSNPYPWAAAIARNEALRRRKQVEGVGVDIPESHGASELDDLPARLDIRAEIASLGPRDRKLLMLRYAADLTQPAVAKAMGMPEGTVKVRLYRLRQHLIKRLKDYDSY